jgi:hypothetical protein
MHRDGYMTEVVVTLKASCLDNPAAALEQLRAAGLQTSQSEDNGAVVEGVIDSSLVPAVEKLDCVQYLRRVNTYAVDFPAGDPRDLNKGISDGSEFPESDRIRRRPQGKSYP